MLYNFCVYESFGSLHASVWNVQAGMGHRPTPHLIGEGGWVRRGGENATPAETILKSVRISVPSGPAASLPQIVRVGNGTRRCNMALSLMNY